MANIKQTKNSSSTSGFVQFPSPKASAALKKSATSKPKQKPKKVPSKPILDNKPKTGSRFPSNSFGDFGFPRTTAGGNGDKTEKIKKIFKEVLGKDPEPRDLSYYRFSPMGEEEIKDHILKGDDHKEILKKGNKYDEINEQLTTQKAKVKVLKGQIDDQLEEFKQIHNLLKEKNRYIRELRTLLPTQVHDEATNIERTNGNAGRTPSTEKDSTSVQPPEPPVPYFTNDNSDQKQKKKGLLSGIFRS